MKIYTFLFQVSILYIFFKITCVHVRLCVHECSCPRSPEGPWKPGAGVAGGRKMSGMGAGNGTQALCRSRPHSQPLSRLSTRVLTTLQQFSINLKYNSNSNLVWFMRPVSRWPLFTSPGPPHDPDWLNFLTSAMGAFAPFLSSPGPDRHWASTHSVLKGSAPPAPPPAITA